MMSRLMIGLLKLYKVSLSPAIQAIGIHCRYDPSCSSYSMEAIRAHGAWYGGWMTLARLLRCHPLRRLGGSSGVDNIPTEVDKPPVWAPWRVGVWRHDNSTD